MNLMSDGRNHFTHPHDSAEPYKKDETNPYVEAFYKWWESDLHKTLDELRITGGIGPKGANGAPPSNAIDAQDGQANKGGGGGSVHYAGNQQSYANAPAGINQGNGGKGVVIVRWS